MKFHFIVEGTGKVLATVQFESRSAGPAVFGGISPKDSRTPHRIFEVDLHPDLPPKAPNETVEAFHDRIGTFLKKHPEILPIQIRRR